MGTCIQPPKTESAWARYIKTPIKEQQKKPEEQQHSELSSIKPQPFKVRSISKFDRIKQSTHQDQPTVQKNKTRMISSFRFEQNQSIGKQKNELPYRVSKSHYKPLNISQILNKSKQTSMIKQATTHIKQIPLVSHIKQPRIKQIKQLSQQSEIIQTSHFPKLIKHELPKHQYSFQNNILTHIKDLDIDIHIQPPKQSVGNFFIQDATCNEQITSIPRKPIEILIPNNKSYFLK